MKNTNSDSDRYNYVLKMRVHSTSYDDVSLKVLSWVRNNSGRYICVSNVHMCMECFDDPSFRKVVNDADLVVPDGRPLVWTLKILGERHATQVRGSDLLLEICRKAEKRSIPIGLYGGTEDSLEDFIKFLQIEFPSLRIPFFSSPPFRSLSQKEKENYVKEIDRSGARILFVGIGCPKQEKWMAEQREKLSCVMIGVGAAFDFFSRRKKHVPIWMQKAGLEWAFRFISDPKRLWKRYLKHNPRFVWYLVIQILSQKMLSKGSK